MFKKKNPPRIWKSKVKLSNLNILHRRAIAFRSSNENNFRHLIGLLAAAVSKVTVQLPQRAGGGLRAMLSQSFLFKELKWFVEIHIFQPTFGSFVAFSAVETDHQGPSRAANNKRRKGRARSHAALDRLTRDETNIDLTLTADRLCVKCCPSRWLIFQLRAKL